jgi:hypothetical protein
MATAVATKAPVLRIRIEQDYDADLSYLAETEEEYQQNGPLMAPECANCGREIETRFTNIRTSPNHLFHVHKGTGRIRCNSSKGYAMAERKPLTWDEYRETFGDPNRYNSYGVIVEKKCRCCGSWDHVTSVWGCDLYEQWADTGTFATLEEIDNQYMREMAEEEMDTALWMIEQESKRN